MSFSHLGVRKKEENLCKNNLRQPKEVLYVRLTRQYFFFNKYYKCLNRKIKTPQSTFIKTNQLKIHK